MTTEIQNKIDSATEHLNCTWEVGEKSALKSLDSSLSALKDTKDIHKTNISYLGNQQIESKSKTIDQFLQQDIKSKLSPSRTVLDALTKKMETLSPAEQKKAVAAFVRDEIGWKLTELCNNRSDIVAALQVYVNGLNDLQGKHAQIPYDATKSYKDYSTWAEKRLFVDGILGPHTYKALWLGVFWQDLDKIFIRKTSAINDQWMASLSGASKVVRTENGQYVKDQQEYHPGLEAIKDKDSVWFVGSDGMVYLPGPDGLWKPYADPNDKFSMEKNNQRIDQPETMPLSYQKMNLFLGFYEIWKQEALNVSGSRNYLNSSWTEDESQIIKNKVNRIDAAIKSQINQINANMNPKLSVSLNFDSLFKIIGEAEAQEDIFGQGDIDAIKSTIVGLKPNTYKNAELSIISQSRKKFSDSLLDTVGLEGGWNSEWAKWWLIESRILKRPEFAQVNVLLSSPAVMEQIKSGDVAGLTQELKKCTILHRNAVPLAQKMIKEYSSIKQKVTKNESQLKDQISDAGKVNGIANPAKQKQIIELWNKENIGMKVINWNQYVNQATELASKSSIEMASMMFLRDLAIEAKLTQKHLAGTAEDPELKELKAILWVGVGISDKNAEWAAEIASTVALSAVTMWTWALVAKSALAAARLVAKATRVASLVSKLEKAAVTGGKIAKLSNNLTKWGIKAAKVSIEWVAFYEWSNTMTNLLTKNSEFFDNAGDWKEIGKSIAFMGALKVMWKYLGKIGQKIWAPTANVPLKFLGWLTVAGIEWAALVWISQGIELAFDGEFHPTWEEFIQAMLLARIAYKVGKLNKWDYKFRKRDGKIILDEQKLLPPHKEAKLLSEKNPAHPDDIFNDIKANQRQQAIVTPETKPTVTPETKPTVTPETKPTVTPETKPNINKKSVLGKLADVVHFPLNSNNMPSRPSINLKTGDVITFKDWYRVRILDAKFWETKYAFEGTPSWSAAWYKWEQWYKNWELFKTEWFKPENIRTVNTWVKKVWASSTLISGQEININ